MEVKRVSWIEIHENPKTKGEWVKECFPENATLDYALPQHWLDKFTEAVKDTGLEKQFTYHFILSTTVYVYPEGNIWGQPISFCKEIQGMIDRFVYDTYRGFYYIKGEEKHQDIQNLLNDLAKHITGKDPSEGFCATCGSDKIKPEDFKDDMSRRDFTIGGMCQACQDSVFESPEDYEEDPEDYEKEL